jgi:hypothetical protein
MNNQHPFKDNPSFIISLAPTVFGTNDVGYKAKVVANSLVDGEPQSVSITLAYHKTRDDAAEDCAATLMEGLADTVREFIRIAGRVEAGLVGPYVNN